jgi:hypothetical protein
VTASIQEEKWGPRVVVGLLHTLLLKSGRPRPLTISLPLWAILTGGKDTFPDIRFAAGRVRSSVPFARVAPHFELALGVSDAKFQKNNKKTRAHNVSERHVQSKLPVDILH